MNYFFILLGRDVNSMINNIINYYMCIFYFYFYGCKHLGIFLSSRIAFYGR